MEGMLATQGPGRVYWGAWTRTTKTSTHPALPPDCEHLPSVTSRRQSPSLIINHPPLAVTH